MSQDELSMYPGGGRFCFRRAGGRRGRGGTILIFPRIRPRSKTKEHDFPFRFIKPKYISPSLSPRPASDDSRGTGGGGVGGGSERTARRWPRACFPMNRGGVFLSAGRGRGEPRWRQKCTTTYMLV